MGFEAAERLNEGGFDGLHGMEGMAGKVFFPDLVPEVFSGVALGAVGWESVAGDVGGGGEVRGHVATRAVQEQQDRLIGMAAGEFGQKDVQAIGTQVGQNERIEPAFRRADSAVGLGVLPDDRLEHERATAWGCPAPAGIGDVARGHPLGVEGQNLGL